MGTGYPEVELAEGASVVPALDVGRAMGSCWTWTVACFSFPSSPPSLLRDTASYLGVELPLPVLPVAPPPPTMPRPGIKGVWSDTAEALPFAPKGNFTSNAPDRELDDVLGRLDAPNEPQLLACACPFG